MTFSRICSFRSLLLFMGILFLGGGEGIAQPLPQIAPTMTSESLGVLRHYADEGLLEARFKAGIALFSGWGGPRDSGTAMRYFYAAAEQGHPEAMAWLGRIHFRGEGVPRSESLALKWIQASVDKGCGLGLYHMGELYQSGFGVRTDQARYVSFLRKAAEKGQADAIAEMGQAYQYGIGVQKDETRAQEWFAKASQQPPSSFYPSTLAWLCRLGLGFPKDPGKSLTYSLRAYREGYSSGARDIAAIFFSGAEGSFPKNYAQALAWAKEAQRKEDAQGYTIEGIIRLRGLAGQKDEEAAFKSFHQGAVRGDPFSMLGLGLCYYSGQGTERNYTGALSWLRKAADSDVSLAWVYVGLLYAKGNGVDQDWGIARNAFLRAASQGNHFGELQMGFLFDGGNGVEKDQKIALGWFQKAAGSNFAPAQNMIGRYYQDGLGGLSKDSGMAVAEFEKAANQGFTSSMWNLACMYKDGDGVPTDLAKSIEWLRKGEAKDYPVCIHELGWFYENGLGVPRDPIGALAYYKKAASLGHAQSYYQLGWIYEHGDEPIQADSIQALAFYRKGAEMGYADAEYKLGRMLLEGTNGPADPAEGRKWLEKASGQGQKDAATLLLSIDSARATDAENEAEGD